MDLCNNIDCIKNSLSLCPSVPSSVCLSVCLFYERLSLYLTLSLSLSLSLSLLCPHSPIALIAKQRAWNYMRREFEWQICKTVFDFYESNWYTRMFHSYFINKFCYNAVSGWPCVKLHGILNRCTSCHDRADTMLITPSSSNQCLLLFWNEEECDTL